MRSAAAVFSSVVLAVSVFVGCGGDDRHQMRNRGDIRVQLPGEEESTRSGSFDFGAVPAGTSKKVTLKLLNVGPDGVAVTSTRFEDAPTGAFFAQPPSTIDANGEGNLILTFSPPSSGPYTGRLIIEHSGESMSASVTLSGQGE